MLTTIVWAVNIKMCCAFNNVSILVVVIWVVVHNKFSVHWGIICKLTIMLQNEFWPQEMHSLFVKLVVTRENIIFINSINVPRGFGKTNFCMRVTFSSASQSWIDNNGNTWFILPTYWRWLQTIKRSSLKSYCSIYQALFWRLRFLKQQLQRHLCINENSYTIFQEEHIATFQKFKHILKDIIRGVYISEPIFSSTLAFSLFRHLAGQINHPCCQEWLLLDS